jgi:uncharacterized protein YqgV (UPF0045/DUF77 family)
MLAEFTVHPMDETHLSMDVAQMMDILEEEGVEYCLSPLSTGVEGSWNEVIGNTSMSRDYAEAACESHYHDYC